MMLSDPAHGGLSAGTTSVQSADGAEVTGNPLDFEWLLFLGESYLN